MTTETVTLHRIDLPLRPCWCWRNAEGGRVSRYFGSEAEARRYKPAYPRR